MIRLISFLSIVLFCAFISCQPENEIIIQDPGNSLQFSSDTISFDTIFTSLGSTTKRLIVKNKNSNAITINQIYLGTGNASSYDITVSGDNKKEIFDQVILGNDSLLILITVTINPGAEELPFVVRDSIVFVTDTDIADVKLSSWGQNARFLGDSVLACNQVWSSELPYFLNGSILVDTLCSLTIEPGVRVYAAYNVYVFVKGTVLINGIKENRVYMTGERLEEKYANIPGQWGGLVFLEGSHSNEITYADIRNAQYGIRIGTPDNDTIPDISIKNSRIENTSSGGIVAFTSDIYVENTLVNTTGGFNLAAIAGGNYRINHSTFANYPAAFFQNGPSCIISDNIPLDNGEVLTFPFSFEMTNSIVWGNWEEEIFINEDGKQVNVFNTSNNILKTSLEIFDLEDNFISTKTDDFKFKDYLSYDYTPDSLSHAIDMAFNSNIRLDLFGQERDSLPDIGAIEFINQK